MGKRITALAVCIMFLTLTTFALAEDVYRTKNGKRYHKAECRLIQKKDKEKIAKEEALEAGLQPCGKCFKEDLSAGVEQKTPKIASSPQKSKKAVK